jgi:hypothetical protein
MQKALQPVNDPQSDPEPAAPSLPAPDPGIFQPPNPRPEPNTIPPHLTPKQ